MAINMVASVPRTVACSESEVLSGQRSQLPGKSLLLGQPCHGAVFLLQLELRNRLKKTMCELSETAVRKGKARGATA
jgi:hypothetical protein